MTNPSHPEGPMTYRAIWGQPFPEHADFPSEAAAEWFAIGKSGEVGEEVAVVEIEESL